MFRGAQIQISRTRWKRGMISRIWNCAVPLNPFYSALIKKSNDVAISPENAKKMFELLNETVDRWVAEEFT